MNGCGRLKRLTPPFNQVTRRARRVVNGSGKNNDTDLRRPLLCYPRHREGPRDSLQDRAALQYCDPPPITHGLSLRSANPLTRIFRACAPYCLVRFRFQVVGSSGSRIATGTLPIQAHGSRADALSHAKSTRTHAREPGPTTPSHPQHQQRLRQRINHGPGILSSCPVLLVPQESESA